MLRRLISCLLILLLLPRPSFAATYTAATCENKSGQTDVQEKINSASDGDTVVIPAGSCTWTTTVTIASKGILLKGAGIGVTNITDQGASSAALTATGLSASHFLRISGITFIESTNHSDGMVQLFGTIGAIAFRWDHNRMSMPNDNGSRGLQVEDIYGLIDHATFDYTASTAGQSITIDGSSTGNDGGYTPWLAALTLGSVNAVYIEDVTITQNDGTETSIDCYTGARVVYRYSTETNSDLGCHGTDSGRNRSAFSTEVYRSTFTSNTTSGQRAFTLRGGTLMQFDNIFNGTQVWQDAALMDYRACPGDGSDYSDWLQAGALNYYVNSITPSAVESRQSSTTGTVGFSLAHPDTLCTPITGDCTRYLDGTGTAKYPHRDQVGRTHDQALAPAYMWGTTGTPVAGAYDGGHTCTSSLPVSTWILENRDFYNYNASFNGSTGVGVGTSLPGTCTTGVGYWKTDEGSWNVSGSGAQGRFYKCTATNTWTLFYTPYTYPYPANAIGDNLTFTAQPTNTVSGGTISPAVVVTVKTPDNTATDTNSVDTITLTISGCGATVNGGSTATAVAALGVATFSNLVISTTATGCTFAASKTGLISATSSSFNVTGASSTPGLGIGRKRR